MSRPPSPRLLALLASLPLFTACAATPPRADDVSAAERERVADAELREARHERAQYDPHAVHSVLQCRNQGRDCQSIAFNPTDSHLDDAIAADEAARTQLALAQSLRNAEAKACAGLPDDDHAESPFHPPAKVLSVTALGSADAPQGAAITVREPPGMTLDLMQRRIACHLAYAAALGHVAPEMPDCPLVPRVQAEVLPDAAAFVVFLRGEDPATDREILRRARALQQ